MRDFYPFFFIFVFLLAVLFAFVLLWEDGTLGHGDKTKARRSAWEPSVLDYVKYTLLPDDNAQGVDRHSL